MKRVLPLLLLFISIGAKGQFIANKLNVYISATHYLGYEGPQFVEEEGFLSPSLFRNMETIRSFSVTGIHTCSPLVSLGMGIDVTNYKDWNAIDYDHYKGSYIRELMISPAIQFHPKRNETGFLNRFKPNIQLGPLLGLALADFTHPPFEIVSSLEPNLTPLLSSREPLFGLKASVGVEMIINRFVGLAANYGIKNTWMSSAIYQDRQVFQSFLDGGIYFRFSKNKRFYY